MEVPGEIPETTPVLIPIVATVVLLLVHIPPPMASVKAVVLLGQSVSMPVMAAGEGFTAIIAVV